MTVMQLEVSETGYILTTELLFCLHPHYKKQNNPHFGLKHMAHLLLNVTISPLMCC